VLSYSEIDTAMTCFARWDFAYGGRLAGSALKKKQVSAVMSAGSAWGEAVAAWHRASGKLSAPFEAHHALGDALDAEAEKLAKLGLPVPLIERVDTENRLRAILDHYMATATPLPNLTRLEEEIVVPIPSRGGRRASSHYRFLAKIDGYTDRDGLEWVVEFKLRGQLTPVWLIELGRQPLMYAWAGAKAHGMNPVGVIVEERLAEPPKPPQRTEKKKVVSHKVEQLTTPELYVAACRENGQEPKRETIEALGQREWQKRVPLPFTPSELDEVGQELVTGAKLIRDLDRGELRPVRNAKRQNCQGCKFRGICKTPRDASVVELDFDRSVPKRMRDEVPPYDLGDHALDPTWKLLYEAKEKAA
jgi:hypothetical protein